jgi:putative copper export protein
VCSTLPLMGHAAGSARVIVHAAHLAAGGLWLGTLGALAASALRPGAGDQSLGSTVVARFSPVALTGAALAGLSGLILAYLYVASLANLTGTPYGQALIVKLTAVFAAATCGFANWRRSRRGDAPSLPTVAIELTFAAGIVGATAVLSELEHP